MYCTKCGTEINDKAIMCTKCGVGIKQGAGTGILVTGYIASIFLPLIGIIIGIYSMAKSKPGHGVAMIILSLIFTCTWAMIM